MIINIKDQVINNWNAIDDNKDIEGVILHFINLEQFIINIKQCTRLNIPFGVCFPCNATNSSEAIMEANYICDILKDYKLSYPVYYNILKFINEYNKLPTLIESFFSTLRHNNYYTALYINQNLCEELYPYTLNIDKCIHDPAYLTTYIGQYGMINLNSKITISGINTEVSMNTCFIDYPHILLENGLN